MNEHTRSADAQQLNRTRLVTVAVAIGLFVAGVALEFAGATVMALVGILALSLDPGGQTVLVAASIAGKVAVALAAAPYVYWRLNPEVDLPSRDQSGLIVATAVVSVLAAVGLTQIRQALLQTETTSVLGGLLSNPSLLPVTGAFVVVVAPLAEELLFRGAIQGRLRRTFGRAPAIVGASTLFGAMHLFNFQGSVIGAVLAAGVIGAVSLLWGYAYERTGNLAVPILIHVLYNFTVFAQSALVG